MINKFKRGFGTYEMLTVFVVILIIVVICLSFVFKSDYKEKYAVMEYNARMFALSANNLSIETGSHGPFYLQELIDQRLSSSIKNPFKGSKYCDSLLSKVVIKKQKKYVTLQCGNYLIYNQDTLDKEFTIYQVGSWKKGNSDDENVQVEDFYNLVEDGKNLFDEDLEEGAFLYSYNMKKGTTYDSINDIPEKNKLVHEVRHRYLEKVN